MLKMRGARRGPYSVCVDKLLRGLRPSFLEVVDRTWCFDGFSLEKMDTRHLSKSTHGLLSPAREHLKLPTSQCI